MFAWIVVGCPTRTQSWWLVVPEAAYTVSSIYLIARPERILNLQSPVKKRLSASAMAAIGGLFVFLSIWTGLTGHCLGTNLNSN
jgi:hypothetical protein